MAKLPKVIQEIEDIASKKGFGDESTSFGKTTEILPGGITIHKIRIHGQLHEVNAHAAKLGYWRKMLSMGQNSSEKNVQINDIERLNREIASLHDELSKTQATIKADKLLIKKLSTLLAQEIEQNKQKFDYLKKRIPEQKMIVLRDISKEQAKKEIIKLFSTKGTLYYSDIASELGLDLKEVVDICNELLQSGEIEIDARA